MTVGGDTRKAAVETMEIYLESEILPRFIGRTIVSTFLLEMAIQDAGLPDEIERYQPKIKSEILIRAMRGLGGSPYSKIGPGGVNAWVLPEKKVKP